MNLTKWDQSDWTEEQKIQWQEKCFALSYHWNRNADLGIMHTDHGYFFIGAIWDRKDSPELYYVDDSEYFKHSINHKELKFEDMFIVKEVKEIKVPDKENKMRLTKWNQTYWSYEQKVQWQEKCFELGYDWAFGGTHKVSCIDEPCFYISKDGVIEWSILRDEEHSFESDPACEKKWEDMFP